MKKNIILKNFLRILYKKISVLSFLTINLIFISTALMFTFVNLLSNYNEVTNEYQLLAEEDIQFVLKNEEINENSEKKIAEKYDLEKVEVHRSKYAQIDKRNIRIVKLPKTINQIKIVEGKLPNSNEEVVLEHHSGKEQKYKLGDKIDFLDKEYKIVGFVSYPNLIAPNMKVSSNVNMDVKKDAIYSFNHTTYENIELEEKQYYVAKGTISKALIKDNLYLQERKNNIEMNSLENQKILLTTILGVSMIVLLSIVFIMIFLVIYKILGENIHQIGVLLSLGYKSSQLILNLVFSIMSYFLIMILSLLFSEWMKKKVFDFFNNQNLIQYPDISGLGLNIVISLAICFLFVCAIILYAMYILKKKTVIEMIYNSGKNNISKFKKKVFSFRLRKNTDKIRKKFALNNFMICFLSFFAGFAIIVQMMFAFGMQNYTNNLSNTIQNSYLYETIYNIVPVEEKLMEENKTYQAYYSSQVKLESEDLVNLVVLQHSENDYLKFGKDIQVLDGVVLNKKIANQLDVGVKDSIEITQADGKKLTLKVGLVEEKVYFGQDIYVSNHYYKKKVNEGLSYNGLYGDSDIDSDNITILNKFNKDSVISNIDTNISLIRTTSILMIILGVLISSLILFIALDVLLKNNENNILLLKVLGYDNKKVYNLLIFPQIYFMIAGVTIAIPYFRMLNKLLFGMISKTSTIYYDFSVNLSHIVLIFVSTIAFFILVSLYFFYKISKKKNIGVLFSDV